MSSSKFGEADTTLIIPEFYSYKIIKVQRYLRLRATRRTRNSYPQINTYASSLYLHLGTFLWITRVEGYISLKNKNGLHNLKIGSFMILNTFIEHNITFSLQ